MLQYSYVPTDWKKSIIIPLRKPEKPVEAADSYRPISLTSCLGKVMERIINRRLSWHFEKNELHSTAQLGFRKGRNTLDNINRPRALHQRRFKQEISNKHIRSFPEYLQSIRHNLDPRNAVQVKQEGSTRTNPWMDQKTSWGANILRKNRRNPL